MTFDLASAAIAWDVDYSATIPSDALPEAKRPYARLLTNVVRTAHLRYQPFQNDVVSDYVSKLKRWLAQFDLNDRRYAFLLAARLVFVTERQFEALQRQLFTARIRRVLLDSAIAKHALPPFSYESATAHLEGEIDATLFVGNSASSHINAFAHINADYFYNRGARRLIGPDVAFWTYPQKSLKRTTLSPKERSAVEVFEERVLATDRDLENKHRLVVIEDFSGSGSDLRDTIELLAASKLPLSEIVIAPAIVTECARERLEQVCARVSSGTRRFELVYAYELRHKFRCFSAGTCPPLLEKSYLDGAEPVPGLSVEIERLSASVFGSHFSVASLRHPVLAPDKRHGFGGLALAFAFFSNCPDNSLPMLWRETPTFFPLFRRASNHL